MQASAQKKRDKSIKMKKFTTTRTLAGCCENAGYEKKQKPNRKNLGGLAIGVG